MDEAMVELNQKIDALTAQVAYLTGQAQLAERGREEHEELMDSMLPIAREAMRVASEQLEDVQRYLDPGELLRIFKKFIRHAPQLDMLLDLLDGVSDLSNELNHITREGMDMATDALEDLDRKGYFAFGRSSLRVVEKVVTSFSEEDVNRLGDNVVLILNTIKDMTQPEIMNFVRSTLDTAGREVEKPVNTSFLALMRQMNDPVVRRGLALTMRMLRAVGQEQN